MVQSFPENLSTLVGGSCAPFPSPTPSPARVAVFKDLFLRRFGVDLGEQEACDLATRYLHIFYLGVTPPPASPPPASRLPEHSEDVDRTSANPTCC